MEHGDRIDLGEICAQRFPRIDNAPRYTETGPGWDGLLVDLCREISAVLETTKSGRLRVHQVKEKFGTLRFYYGLDSVPRRQSARIFAIDSKFDTRSGRTCETCGKPGLLRSGSGWWHTACDEHAKGSPAEKSDPCSADLTVSRSISGRRMLTETFDLDEATGSLVLRKRTSKATSPRVRKKMREEALARVRARKRLRDEAFTR